MKKKPLFIVLSIFLVATFFLCYKGVFFRKDFNVLLISMDTTRADRLGCYGYDKNTTPNIDSFAKEAVLFKSVVAPIPFTFPSHLSMMTGTIPPYHGVHDNDGRTIKDSHLTLAEVLKDNGYKTAAIIASFALNVQFGLDQGFDSYSDFKDHSEGKVNFINGRRASDTARLTNKWLQENKDDKFFLFTHYYDPHYPYNPPEGFIEPFKDSPYDGEIASVDHAIGQVIEKLKELGLYDNTMIIITSDHGEMLGQHEEGGHGYYIYEGAVKVPLIVKVPGSKKSRRIDETVGLIDIFPTVCSYLGIDVPDFIQGVDLSLYFKGQSISEHRYQYTESLTATKFGGNSLLGVVGDQYKYIQTTRSELYNFVKDPGEQNNLIADDAKRARLMQGNLKIILDSCAEFGAISKAEVDLEVIKKLESLGYIGGEVDASLSFDQSKPDPKDIMHLYAIYRDTINATIREDWENARIHCDRLLAEFPDMEFGHMISARIWAAGIKAEPDKAKAYEKVADMYFSCKKYDRAIENWTEALEQGGDSAELRKKLAVANVHLENTDEAIVQFKKSLEFNPDQADVNVSLGKISLALGKKDEALKYWTNSLKIEPVQPGLHNELAKIYYQQRKLGKVIEHWTKAAGLEPENAEILNNLAWMCAATKDAEIRDPQKALEYALQACALTKYDKADHIDTLAVAYAANGQFSKAVETALNALELAVSAGQENLNKLYYD